MAFRERPAPRIRRRHGPLPAVSPPTWPGNGRTSSRPRWRFQDDFEACIAHLRMPVRHRKAIRTTNLLERLFGEERRRLKVIPRKRRFSS